MALTGCFVQTGTLQGLMTCLRDSENLSGVMVVAILLIGWLSLQLIGERRQRLKAEKDQKAGVAAVIPFGSRAHAQAVCQFANWDMYQYLLAELEKALLAEGCFLTLDCEQRVLLSDDSRRRVARQVFVARARYMMPMQPDHVVAKEADECAMNGYSTQWLYVLIQGSEQLGWYITRAAEQTASQNIGTTPEISH